MRKTRRAAGRGNRARAQDLIVPACAVVCTFILLTISALTLFERNDGKTDAPGMKLILERMDIDPDVDIELVIELIGTGGGSRAKIDLTGSAPSVLIYHTHTKEGYFPTEEYDYEPESGWRCHDDTMNIVAVGETLARTLREDYGISVIHDTTNHEPPKLSSAYSRSLETMLYYKEKYPSITLFIDIHRDAYGEPTEPADYIMVDGRECARIMFVVGTGEGATGTGFDEMPDFASNHALAESISACLTAIDKALVRNIRIKTGRYNQHVSSACLLAEIGHNANTFEQAQNSARLLAGAIAEAAAQSPPQASREPASTILPLAP